MDLGWGEWVNQFFTLFIVLVPLSLLGLWELFDIVCWFFHHLHWS